MNRNFFCIQNRQRQWWRSLLLSLLAVALLSGCAALRGGMSSESRAAASVAGLKSEQQAEQQEQRFSGRMAVVVRAHVPQERARQSAARFHLHTTDAGARGTLTLTSPLGAAVGRVRWSPAEAVVTDGSGGQTRFDSFAAMMHEVVGVRVTAHRLLDWMQPAETGKAVQQQGWVVDSSGYSVAQRAGRIRVSRRSPLPEIQVTLVLDAAAATD